MPRLAEYVSHCQSSEGVGRDMKVFETDLGTVQGYQGTGLCGSLSETMSIFAEQGQYLCIATQSRMRTIPSFMTYWTQRTGPTS